MHPAPLQWAGDHLHGLFTPCPGDDAAEAGITREEQRGLPATQTLRRQGLYMVLGGVQQHHDQAVGGPIRRAQPALVQAKMHGHR